MPGTMQDPSRPHVVEMELVKGTAKESSQDTWQGDPRPAYKDWEQLSEE